MFHSTSLRRAWCFLVQKETPPNTQSLGLQSYLRFVEGGTGVGVQVQSYRTVSEVRLEPSTDWIVVLPTLPGPPATQRSFYAKHGVRGKFKVANKNWLEDPTFLPTSAKKHMQARSLKMVYIHPTKVGIEIDQT